MIESFYPLHIQVSWRAELEVSHLGLWKSPVSMLNGCIGFIERVQYVVTRIIYLQLYPPLQPTTLAHTPSTHAHHTPLTPHSIF